MRENNRSEKATVPVKKKKETKKQTNKKKRDKKVVTKTLFERNETLNLLVKNYGVMRGNKNYESFLRSLQDQYGPVLFHMLLTLRARNQLCSK